MKFIEVNGDSMNPLLQNGQILVAKGYNLNKIKKNEIIAYNFLDKLMIKRLVGPPNSKVIIEDDKVTVNDILLFHYSTQITQYYELELDSNHVYVIGDNPHDSLDSRKIGPIPINEICYKILGRIWPPKRF